MKCMRAKRDSARPPAHLDPGKQLTLHLNISSTRMSMRSRRYRSVSNRTAIDNRRRLEVERSVESTAPGHCMPCCKLSRMNAHLTVDTILQRRLAWLGGCCCCRRRLCFISSSLLLELPVGRGLWDYICKKLEIVDASHRSGLEGSALWTMYSERGKLTHILVRNVPSRFSLGFDNIVCLLG